VRQRLESRVDQAKGEVLLRRDLKDLGSPSQLSRALEQLVAHGKLVPIGHGVYAKAMPAPLCRQPIPRQPLQVLAAETFNLLAYPWQQGEAQGLYNAGLITQVPWRTTFDTGPRRISRWLQVGRRVVTYEKISRTAESNPTSSPFPGELLL